MDKQEKQKNKNIEKFRKETMVNLVQLNRNVEQVNENAKKLQKLEQNQKFKFNAEKS